MSAGPVPGEVPSHRTSNDTKCAAMCSADGCRGSGEGRAWLPLPPALAPISQSGAQHVEVNLSAFDLLLDLLFDLLFAHLPEQLKIRSVGGYTCPPYWMIPYSYCFQGTRHKAPGAP